MLQLRSQCGTNDISIFNFTNKRINLIIEYPWKERDTRKKGIFEGRFEIIFNDDLRKPSTETEIYQNGEVTMGNAEYPKGKFVVPIYEDLKIEIK